MQNLEIQGEHSGFAMLVFVFKSADDCDQKLKKRAHLGKISPPLISIPGETLQNTSQAFPQEQIQEYPTAG